jgi:hypothetical protein
MTRASDVRLRPEPSGNSVNEALVFVHKVPQQAARRRLRSVTLPACGYALDELGSLQTEGGKWGPAGAGSVLA